MSLLESYAADLFQDGQIMAHCLDTQTFLYYDIFLKFPDELLVELAESKVGYFEPATDEICETVAGIEVIGKCTVRHVDAYTCPDFFNMPVEELEQCHLRVLAALKDFLDCRRIEIGLSFQKGVERGVYSQQQLVDFCVDFHCLLTLAVQTAFPGIPQLGSAGELAAELCHRPVNGDAPHYRGFARLVQSALFEVEQYLEFFYFHTLIFLVANLPVL